MPEEERETSTEHVVGKEKSTIIAFWGTITIKCQFKFLLVQ